MEKYEDFKSDAYDTFDAPNAPTLGKEIRKQNYKL